MLTKENKLSREKDFKEIFRKGKTFKQDCLVVRFIFNNKENSRFGFVVSLKISKKAIERNKIKRRLKYIIKKNLLNIKKGFDIVIITLPGIEKKSYTELKETTREILKRAGLFLKK